MNWDNQCVYYMFYLKYPHRGLLLTVARIDSGFLFMYYSGTETAVGGPGLSYMQVFIAKREHFLSLDRTSSFMNLSILLTSYMIMMNVNVGTNSLASTYL